MDEATFLVAHRMAVGQITPSSAYGLEGFDERVVLSAAAALLVLWRQLEQQAPGRVKATGARHIRRSTSLISSSVYGPSCQL